MLQGVHRERFICVRVSVKRFILLNRKGKAAGAGVAYNVDLSGCAWEIMGMRVESGWKIDVTLERCWFFY